MKSSALLIAHLAGFGLGLTVVCAQAQTSPDRYVVLKNLTAISGQAQVGGKVAIPLNTSVNAVVNPDGNIVVECLTGGLAPAGTCSNVGTGGGTAPAQPSVSLTAPVADIVAPGAKITWSSTGADACYGISATTSTVGAPAVAGWTKEWPNTLGGAGFSLDSIFGQLAAGSTATYNFNLRCYSTAVGTAGATPIVSYEDESVTVNFNKPTGGGGQTGDWCLDYLDTLSPAERQNFEAYRAENRGFSAFDTTFSGQTSKVLGTDFGPVGPGIAPVLPGKQASGQYHAMSFSLPQTAGSDGFDIKFSYKAGTGGPINHDAIATISPCKGDFRPVNTASDDAYVSRGYCRTPYTIEGKRLRGSRNAGQFECPIPAGRTMYVNVSVRDMYDLQITGANSDTYPNCEPAKYCGKGADVYTYPAQ